MQSEKQNYTLMSEGEAQTPAPLTWIQRNRRPIWWLVATLVWLTFGITQSNSVSDLRILPVVLDSRQPACPQFPALKAQTGAKEKFERDIKDVIDSEDFLQKSLKRLQGAVQIPTESFDDMGDVGKDPRWDIFADFHEYLKKTFPLIHMKLDFTPVNTYGILLEWKGKDESLKPYLFMGHQDVVPVPPVTEKKWTYPPYSAHYDGRFIWGRGATDCKNVLIGVLETFETLLEHDFIPQRTLLAAFGFDEEMSGPRGARLIAEHLQSTKGKDSIDLILDEGGQGIKEMNGAIFALPGLGEKGYFNVRITVETPGGHSSLPQDHTSIGILSRIISTIEDHPYEPELTQVNPYFTTLQCVAEYSPDIDPWLRKKIQKSLGNKKAAKTVAMYLSKKDILQRYSMQTSQATDLVFGGVKLNALPEKAYAVINHRTAVESRSSEISANLQSLIESKILTKFPSMALNAWGEISGNTSSTAVGTIFLEAFDPPLEPSPVSPTDTQAYKIFSGTIKQVMGADVIVAPSLMTGNTDTRHYWPLSKNIYRFAPVRDGGRENAHTVDERVGMREHIEGVRFYTQLILNSDHS